MAEFFRVEGRRKLAGTVRPAGNKNAALPMISAALLADGVTVIRNVPRITDVEALLDLVRDVGGVVEWTNPNSVSIDTSNILAADLDPILSARIRASILLAGPLLARLGRVVLPPPGGDVIGRRRVDTHFMALAELGADVSVGEQYKLEAPGLTGADIFLDEPSVTATENVLMAAAAAKGTTIIRNAASEPHVQDLVRALVQMGADIDGIGTNVLTVNGKGGLLEPAEIEVGPDHIEIGSFIGLAAVTDSDITVEGVRPEDLRGMLLQFEKLGITPTITGSSLHIAASQERRVRSDIGGHVPKIEDGPWPAFPADLTSIALVVATQCEGLVMVFEKMFESRLYFVDKLISLGARIVLCDPHRAVISGPSDLHGGTVESPDIRAGMAMLLAALSARGTSEIHNIGQIDRGYERIDERLRELGAGIERASSPAI